MGKRKQKKEETRTIRNPLLERIFAHYQMHPNDRVTGEMVEKYYAEQFRIYCLTAKRKDVVFVDKEGNRTIV